MNFTPAFFKGKKSSELYRIKNKYSEEDAALLIHLWKQRMLRTYITDEIPDFQAHLTEVLLDRLDDKIESEYSTDFYMKYKRFIASVNSEKLFREVKMKDTVDAVSNQILEYYEGRNLSLQQMVYNYFLENYDI